MGKHNYENLKLTFLKIVVVYQCLTSTAMAANVPSSTSTPEVASDVRVQCNNDEILVSITTRSGRFNGMVYPRGLSKNSTCMGEWIHKKSPIAYTLPLRGCNTMSTDLVLATLNFLATGSFQNPVGCNIWLSLSQTMISRIIFEITALVTNFLFPIWIKFPINVAEKNNIKQGFYEKWDIRGVIGVIDGTHVEIIAPPINDVHHPPFVYINRKGRHSINVMLDDGGIEYYNTIVVQPHLKLVTNQGRGFHIRCRYNTRNNTVTNDSLKVDLMAADPLTAIAPMPGCSMRIFSGDPTKKEVAENVKIGDPLTLVVTLDEQDIYGIQVTDCLVRDGLGWGEQKLINDDGCPTDPEIMGMFRYSEDKSKAYVEFQAHKFPYTASVYYQCNVKLCLKADKSCDIEPTCWNTNGNRIRRQARSQSTEVEGTPATINVYSGLYVNEVNDLAKAEEDSVFSEKTSDSICISQKSFAIGICIAGLILMLCVVAAILCLLAKRRKKTTSHSSGSIYSGPYTNTAYSHTS